MRWVVLLALGTGCGGADGGPPRRGVAPNVAADTDLWVDTGPWGGASETGVADARWPPCAWAPRCADLSGAAPTWGLASGWEMGPAQLVPDVTGDGLRDAFLQVWTSDGGDRRDLIVASPLRMPRTLPDAAWAWADRFALRVAGDVDGDGRADLWVDGRVVLGPSPQGALTAELGVLDAEYLAEVNGDAYADLLVRVPGGLDVYLGPWSGSLGQPALRVRPSCVDGSMGLPEIVPDLDGDGANELYVVTDHPYSPCRPFLVAGSATGVLDPYTEGKAAIASLPGGGWGGPYTFGDLTGDGLRDVEADGWVYPGPATLAGANGILYAGPPFALTGDRAKGWWRVPLDMEGDGFGEFLRYDHVFLGGRKGFVWDLLSGGPAGGLFGAPALARWGLKGHDPVAFGFVEEGMAWLALGERAAGVVIVEAGPATYRDPVD